MSRPTYIYKGFKFYNIQDGLYSIDHLTETYAYLEKAPESYGGGYFAITPTVQGEYAELSQRLARGEYAGKSAREAFHNWVNENYGNAYARKN
nr:MAG TPA: hypothetical protein [Caudoviricetes sp.]